MFTLQHERSPHCSAHEFHETCHSVTFIVLVNSHQRWKQTRNRVCFHLWCELTLALWCHSIVCSLFSWNKMYRNDKFHGIDDLMKYKKFEMRWFHLISTILLYSIKFHCFKKFQIFLIFIECLIASPLTMSYMKNHSVVSGRKKKWKPMDFQIHYFGTVFLCSSRYLVLSLSYSLCCY